MGRIKRFSRDDVLQNSLLVFWDKGFAGTSLRDIERATGVFKSGLYSEFKDKDDLFLNVIRYYKSNHPSRKILSRLPLGWKNIQEFLEAIFLTEGQKGDFIACMLRELNVLPKELKEAIEEISAGCIREMMSNLVAAGVKSDAEQILDYLATFHYGLTVKAKLQPREAIESEIKQFIEHLQLYKKQSE